MLSRPAPASETPTRTICQRGFSMMEIMIVMVIIGLFITIGARNFKNSSNEMKSSVRRFTTLAKKLRQRARIDNKTYRLVFDFPIDSRKMQSYWVESTDKQALLLSIEEREKMSKEAADDYEPPEGNEDLPPPDPQGFVADSKVLKNAPEILPRGLYFESIELDGEEVEKIKDGRVYIYFFPQGRVQTSAIHLTDRANKHWTISIEGISGRVQLYPEYRGLAELIDRK